MSSGQISLNVPEKGKKTRPKSPRRKAPSAPKKKRKTSPGNDSQSQDLGEKLRDVPNEDGSTNAPEGGGKGDEKVLQRSVSPRKEQYMSLLDEMAGQGDMVLLDPITEDSILQNLNKRYTAGEIYVSEGRGGRDNE